MTWRNSAAEQADLLPAHAAGIRHESDFQKIPPRTYLTSPTCFAGSHSEVSQPGLAARSARMHAQFV